MTHKTSPVHEALFLDVNGQQQWFTIRGKDSSNPVLFIVGGPGAGFSTMAMFFEPWETHFTLVQWDQPGAGATVAKNGADGLQPFTLDRLSNDLVTASTLVCDYLRIDALILLGFSGGTVPGLMAMHDPLHLFSTFIGCGTFVHWQRQARHSYDLVLRRARDRRDVDAVMELGQIGPPPYTDIGTEVIKSKYAGAMTPVEKAAMADLDPEVLQHMWSPPARADYIAEGVSYPPVIEQATKMFDRLRPDLCSFDAWQLPMQYDVPMVFIQGEEDQYSVTADVEQFMVEIDAPYKCLRLVPGAGHGIMFLRERLLEVLLQETGKIPG